MAVRLWRCGKPSGSVTGNTGGTVIQSESTGCACRTRRPERDRLRCRSRRILGIGSEPSSDRHSGVVRPGLRRWSAGGPCCRLPWRTHPSRTGLGSGARSRDRFRADRVQGAAVLAARKLVFRHSLPGCSDCPWHADMLGSRHRKLSRRRVRQAFRLSGGSPGVP